MELCILHVFCMCIILFSLGLKCLPVLKPTEKEKDLNKEFDTFGDKNILNETQFGALFLPENHLHISSYHVAKVEDPVRMPWNSEENKRTKRLISIWYTSKTDLIRGLTRNTNSTSVFHDRHPHVKIINKNITRDDIEAKQFNWITKKVSNWFEKYPESISTRPMISPSKPFNWVTKNIQGNLKQYNQNIPEGDILSSIKPLNWESKTVDKQGKTHYENTLIEITTATVSNNTEIASRAVGVEKTKETFESSAEKFDDDDVKCIICTTGQIVSYLLALLLPLLLLSCALLAWMLSKKTIVPKDWLYVGKLKEMYIYPVKSCAPIRITEADVSPRGLKTDSMKDRYFMVIDDENNCVMSRSYPILLGVKPTFLGSVVILKHKCMETLKLPLPVNSKGKLITEPENLLTAYLWGTPVRVWDCGRHASAWFTRLICNCDGCIFKLVRYAAKEPHKIKDYTVGAFSDRSTYHLINEATVDCINTRIGTLKNNITSRNYRPNFVIAGNIPAFSEDKWKFIKIGTAIFEVTKLCARCIVISYDPESEIRNIDGEPFSTLQRYRHCYDHSSTKDSDDFGPNMGLYLALRSQNTKIQIGDVVSVARKPCKTCSDSILENDLRHGVSEGSSSIIEGPRKILKVINNKILYFLKMAESKPNHHKSSKEKLKAKSNYDVECKQSNLIAEAKHERIKKSAKISKSDETDVDTTRIKSCERHQVPEDKRNSDKNYEKMARNKSTDRQSNSKVKNKHESYKKNPMKLSKNDEYDIEVNKKNSCECHQVPEENRSCDKNYKKMDENKHYKSSNENVKSNSYCNVEHKQCNSTAKTKQYCCTKNPAMISKHDETHYKLSNDNNKDNSYCDMEHKQCNSTGKIKQYCCTKKTVMIPKHDETNHKSSNDNIKANSHCDVEHKQCYSTSKTKQNCCTKNPVMVSKHDETHHKSSNDNIKDNSYCDGEHKQCNSTGKTKQYCCTKKTAMVSKPDEAHVNVTKTKSCECSQVPEDKRCSAKNYVNMAEYKPTQHNSPEEKINPKSYCDVERKQCNSKGNTKQDCHTEKTVMNTKNNKTVVNVKKNKSCECFQVPEDKRSSDKNYEKMAEIKPIHHKSSKEKIKSNSYCDVECKQPNSKVKTKHDSYTKKPVKISKNDEIDIVVKKKTSCECYPVPEDKRCSDKDYEYMAEYKPTHNKSSKEKTKSYCEYKQSNSTEKTKQYFCTKKHDETHVDMMKTKSCECPQVPEDKKFCDKDYVNMAENKPTQHYKSPEEKINPKWYCNVERKQCNSKGNTKQYCCTKKPAMNTKKDETGVDLTKIKSCECPQVPEVKRSSEKDNEKMAENKPIQHKLPEVKINPKLYCGIERKQCNSNGKTKQYCCSKKPVMISKKDEIGIDLTKIKSCECPPVPEVKISSPEVKEKVAEKKPIKDYEKVTENKPSKGELNACDKSCKTKCCSPSCSSLKVVKMDVGCSN